MKFNYALVSRSLIALLFVVAGVQKLMNFSQTSDTISSLGVPLAPLATLLVIAVEVPVALAFAWGYNTKKMGYTLIGFTVLATLLVHKDLGQGMNLVMTLKNIAIIGGIMSAVACACSDCTVHSKKHHSA